MQHLFTGSRPRATIDLSGARSADATQTDLIARARREREEREAARAREKAALVIQAFYRGRRAASYARSQFRAQFDTLLPSSPSSSASAPSPEDVLRASRLLAVLFVSGDQSDARRAKAWCGAVLRSTNKIPLLFSLFAHPSWPPLVQRIACRILFRSAVSSLSLPQAPLFLELLKILSDPANYARYRAPSGLICEEGSGGEGVPGVLKALLSTDELYAGLRTLLLSAPAEKNAQASLPACVALALLPFKAYPAQPSPHPQRAAALLAFATSILSIPSLSTRLPAKESAALSSGLPFGDILSALSSSSYFDLDLALDPPAAANLLANLLCDRGRVQSIADGKTLKAYLEVAAGLMERAGKGVFAPPVAAAAGKAEGVKGKGKEVEEIVLSSDDDEEGDNEEAGAVQRARAAVSGDSDVAMAPLPASSSASAPLALPPSTLTALTTLHSKPTLLTLLTLSTRFSASTRPALAHFLSTLLALLPPSSAARAEALNTLLYAPGNAGLGLVRELFRGYVRGGRLGRFLAGAGRGDAQAVLASLSDPAYAGGENEWATLILTAELYARALVTLGDDEFYASSSASAASAVSSRNPLTLDEVTTLSLIARNAAFALYWLAGGSEVDGGEGAGGGGGMLSKKVVGTAWTFEDLRGLLTGFLGEVHARDSRRPFTPKGHWHMTSSFDLQSFVQTAVYEDERLSASPDASSSGAGAPVAMDTDSDEEEDEFLPRRRRLPRQQSRAQSARSAVLSKRQMALVSPRLGVLNNIPFVIPFETRLSIFRQFVASDFAKLGLDANGHLRRAGHRAVIRRNHLAEDAYTHLNGLGSDLKKRVEISFIDEHGLEESGIDGGGLYKELLTSLTKEVFDSNRGLWLETAQQELYPNPHAYAKGEAQLPWYTFIGRILGAALYRGILVNVRFANFFLAKWLGRQSYLDDLASLDPELYRGLIKLKTYPGNVEEDLSLNFTITEDDFGVSRTIDLIPGGSEIPVTNDNRMQYIVLVSHYRLNVQIAPQCRAFFKGLSEIINPRWLRMFNQSELAVLVGGTDEAIDIDDLKRNTVYSGWSADENTPTIQAFWDVVASFSKEERAQLVRFVTSCERPPLLGFSQLNPLFAIRKSSDDQERLPTSATCVNLLKLPEYTDPANLREKLLYAITSGAGFDLS
ncbi:hypothetical protein JCM10213_002049 [Rhodosporidiobolus nylandii]